MQKKKLSLDELKVQSFVTELDKTGDQTDKLQGGFTGNCGTPVNVTCGDCDFQSIPLDECTTKWTVCGVACSKVPVIYC